MPRIVEIKDISQPELDAYARLTEAQLRNRLEPEKGIFIAESPKVISLALDGGYQPLSILTERKHIEGSGEGNNLTLSGYTGLHRRRLGS